METSFNAEKAIVDLIKTGNREERIVGLFMRAKKMNPENELQFKSIVRRQLPEVGDLVYYSDKKIITTLKHLIDTADFKWKLTTLFKYIDEDLEELQGDEPIIKLKNGERIYDIEELKRLESSGRIYYDNGTWRERNL